MREEVYDISGMHCAACSASVEKVTRRLPGVERSDVNLVANGKTVNAKSIMNLIAACIKCGTEVEVQCSGPDEEAALLEAVRLIENGLGE